MADKKVIPPPPPDDATTNSVKRVVPPPPPDEQTNTPQQPVQKTGQPQTPGSGGASSSPKVDYLSQLKQAGIPDAQISQLANLNEAQIRNIPSLSKEQADKAIEAQKGLKEQHAKVQAEANIPQSFKGYVWNDVINKGVTTKPVDISSSYKTTAPIGQEQVHPFDDAFLDAPQTMTLGEAQKRLQDANEKGKDAYGKEWAENNAIYSGDLTKLFPDANPNTQLTKAQVADAVVKLSTQKQQEQAQQGKKDNENLEGYLADKMGSDWDLLQQSYAGQVVSGIAQSLQQVRNGVSGKSGDTFTDATNALLGSVNTVFQMFPAAQMFMFSQKMAETADNAIDAALTGDKTYLTEEKGQLKKILDFSMNLPSKAGESVGWINKTPEGNSASENVGSILSTLWQIGLMYGGGKVIDEAKSSKYVDSKKLEEISKKFKPLNDLSRKIIKKEPVEAKHVSEAIKSVSEMIDNPEAIQTIVNTHPEITPEEKQAFNDKVELQQQVKALTEEKVEETGTITPEQKTNLESVKEVTPFVEVNGNKYYGANHGEAIDEAKKANPDWTPDENFRQENGKFEVTKSDGSKEDLTRDEAQDKYGVSASEEIQSKNLSETPQTGSVGVGGDVVKNEFTGNDVFYHGAKKSFDKFEKVTKAGQDKDATEQPIFLSEDKEFADANAIGKDATTMEVKVKNGKYFDFRKDVFNKNGSLTPLGEKIRDAVDSGEINLEGTRFSDYDGDKVLNNKLSTGDYDFIEKKAFIDWLKKEGYDGTFLREHPSQKATNLAVWNTDKLEVNKPKSETPQVKEKVEETGDQELTNISNKYHQSKLEGKYGEDVLKQIIADSSNDNFKKSVNDAISDKTLDEVKLKEIRNKIKKGQGGTTQDQAALLKEAFLLEGKENSLKEKIQSTTDNAEKEKLMKDLSDVKNEIIDNAYANNLMGKTWSAVGKIRQVMLDHMGDINSMISDFAAGKGVKVEDLSKEDLSYVKDFNDKIKDLKKQLDTALKEATKEREEKENILSSNKELQKAVENAKLKYNKSTNVKNAETAKANVKSAVEDFKKVFSFKTESAQAIGILNPEIYKSLAKIAINKVAEIYYETKSKVELKALTEEVLKELETNVDKDIRSKIKQKDIIDAISGNYEKKQKTKSELQGIQEQTKKEARILTKYSDLFKEGIPDTKEELNQKIQEYNDKLQEEKEKGKEGQANYKEIQKQLSKLNKLREGELPEKKIAKEDIPIVKRLKDMQKKEIEAQTVGSEKYDKEAAWQKQKLQQLYKNIKLVNDKIKKGEFKEKDKEDFSSNDKIIKAERELGRARFEWHQKIQENLHKDQSWWEKFKSFQRFAILTSPKALGKITASVLTGITDKPAKIALNIMLNKLGVLSGSKVYGDPKITSLGTYYSAFIRSFTLENLKTQFQPEKAKFLAATSDYSDFNNGIIGKVFDMPGLTHKYMQSFLKNPEYAWAHEQIMSNMISEYEKANEQLKNKDLSTEERKVLEQKKLDNDVLLLSNLDKVNHLAENNASWSILMNKNQTVSWVRNSLKITSNDATATKIVKGELQTEVPILTIPINGVERYFQTKFGVVKTMFDAASKSKAGYKALEEEGNKTYNPFKMISKGVSLMSEEEKMSFDRIAIQGTMGLGMASIGVVLAANKLVKKDNDGNYNIDGVKVNPFYISHVPELQNMLSGADAYNSAKGKDPNAGSGSILSQYVISGNIKELSNIPFVSQMQYGFIPQLSKQLYIDTRNITKGKKEESLPKYEKLFTEKIVNTLNPQILQQLRDYVKDSKGEPKTTKDVVKKALWMPYEGETKTNTSAEKEYEKEQRNKEEKENPSLKEERMRKTYVDRLQNELGKDEIPDNTTLEDAQAKTKELKYDKQMEIYNEGIKEGLDMEEPTTPSSKESEDKVAPKGGDDDDSDNGTVTSDGDWGK